METTRNRTEFNPTQQHLLKMFSFMKSEDQLKELKKVLADYYFQQIEQGMAELETQGKWGREKCEAIAKEHLRTPYNS
ncbi:MAG: hypothetical protein K6A96_04100 [Prevotella sp.]|nr:hypothetical protein [Prevotella sp.]